MRTVAWSSCPYCDASSPRLLDDDGDCWCAHCDARWPADPSPRVRRLVLEHAAYIRALCASTARSHR